ncbi:MAG: GNAT family N-acetyltransferase [Fimbriimonadaceae bacterium]
MEFRVRPATQDDAPGVVAVVQAVYDEYGFTWEEEGYHADLYNLGSHYLAVGHLFVVAEAEERVVGTVALELFCATPGQFPELVTVEGKVRVGGCDCALNRLYVHPRARRFGVGRALTEHVIRAARSARRRGMEIWSDKRFVAAHELYGRFGAQVVGERICDDPDVSPEWGLAIEL